MLNIALFGPPGAGKGTQSKLLIDKYNLTYISTGDILREEITNGTKLGMKAKGIIEKGGLADDEIIVQILEERITNMPTSNGILFDGFPRTIVQAYILEGLLLKMNSKLSCMLSLEVPKEDLMKRMIERSKTSGRKDDALEVIKFRLQEYDNKTAPVADFYKEKQKYFPIDGLGTVEKVFKRLTQSVEKTLEKTWLNIVLHGAPGSGKGTQAKIIAKKYGMVYVSTGKLLRKEVAENTDIGKISAPFMEKGDIVPDEIAIRLIEREIKNNTKAKGFIFKGFPRTIVQAYILDGLLRRLNTSVSLMVELEISTIEAIRRLQIRGASPKKRSYDQNTEVILHRLELYENKTLPVSNYYKKQKKYISVDGARKVEDIYQELCEIIDNEFKKVR